MMKSKLGTKLATLGAAFFLLIGGSAAYASEGDTTGMEQGGGHQSDAYCYGIYVEEGIISEDTLDSIVSYYEENAETLAAEKEEEKALLDEMTEEERETYLESVDTDSILDDLVTEGILTEDEETAIIAYNEENDIIIGGMGNQGPGGMGGQGQGQGPGGMFDEEDSE